MTGASFAFVGFGILVALLMTVSRALWWRDSVIIVASVVFLASFSHDPVEFLPFAAFIALGFACLRIPDRYRERTFPFVIIGTVAFFTWIKQYAFVPDAIVLRHAYVSVGISYILFRMLHLLIETRADPAYARMPFPVYLTYLISFHTLIAGPIQTFDEYLTQRGAPPADRSLADTGEAVERIVIGLFKTNVLAAIFSAQHDSFLAELHGGPDGLGRMVAAVGLFATYPLFLYCNFSGYIDIVIGIGRLMGFRLPENFNRPFSASSFIDFWGRWHITLSQWFRRYVYNPLLMMLLRRFPERRLEPLWASSAFFVTFFLVGVWHGQTSAFLFFGFLQGFGISANKSFQLAMSAYLGKKRYMQLSSRTLYRAVGRGLTFAWFTLTLTWFWASWSEATHVWSALRFGEWIGVWTAITLGATLVLQAWELAWSALVSLRSQASLLLESPRLRTAWGTALLVVTTVVILLANQPAPGIVYKKF